MGVGNNGVSDGFIDVIGMQHGDRTVIVNTNVNFIGLKLRLVSITTGVGCNSHARYVRQVT